MTLGEKIQNLRKEKGLSQDALAGMLYVTRQSVSQWENGRSMPSVDLLLKIGMIFDVSVDSLLGKDESEAPEKSFAAAELALEKRQIRRIMKYEYAATVTALLASMSGVMLYWLLYNLIFSVGFGKIPYDNTLWNFIHAVICGVLALLSGVFVFLRYAHGRSAYLTAQRLGSEARFFSNRMEIPNDGGSVTFFYTEFRQIFENEHHLVFRLKNGGRLCVDKDSLTGDSESALSAVRSVSSYKRRIFAKNNFNKEYSSRTLYVLRAAAIVLFVLCFASRSISSCLFALSFMIDVDRFGQYMMMYVIPLILPAGALVFGIILTIRRLKALWLIIAGGLVTVYMIISSCLFALTPLYDLQREPLTPENFTELMESKGMSVEETIYGRTELYMRDCLTASNSDGTLEIMYFRFWNDDGFTDGYRSAIDLYDKLVAEFHPSYDSSMLTSVYLKLHINGFQTSHNDKRYLYISHNRNAIVYINCPLEKTDEVRTVMADYEI